MRTRKPKKRKTPAKGVTLDDKWLRNAAQVKAFREEMLTMQKGLCAITGYPIDTGCLDHCHTNGKVRGVLCSEANTLEGRFLSLFKRMKVGEKYNISFEDFLINMGTYLKQDNSEQCYHHKFMEDFRKKVNRLLKEDIRAMLLSDYGIDSSGDKRELVQLYTQAYVNSLNS